jgi:hypothetical protein
VTAYKEIHYIAYMNLWCSIEEIEVDFLTTTWQYVRVAKFLTKPLKSFAWILSLTERYLMLSSLFGLTNIERKEISFKPDYSVSKTCIKVRCTCPNCATSSVDATNETREVTRGSYLSP